MNFTYQPQPIKILFGSGRVQELTEEVRLLGKRRLGVLASKRYARLVEHLQDDFGAEEVVAFSNIVQHIPEEIVQEAKEALSGAEVLVAVGGGSTIGLAKAISLDTGLPIIAVPTTFSGSEMTNIYGISRKGKKTVGRNDRTFPKTVIYDSNLLLDLPPHLVATSAMNAMAHLIEALYAKDSNPITYQAALQGIQALRIGMETYVNERNLQTAVETLLFGAHLGGRVLSEVGMALQHKLAHLLGGSFGLEHSQTHSVLLPYVLAFNSAGAKRVVEDLKTILHTESPPQKLRELAEGLGAPVSLEQIGFSHQQIGLAAKQIAGLEFYNPIEVTEESALALLESAYFGDL